MNAQDVKTVTLVINSDQAKKKLDSLVQQLDQAKKKRQEAFDKGDAKGIEVYTREAAKLERQISRVQSRAQTVEKVLRSLDHATPNELKKTIREINKELNSGSVERGSREWNVLTNALAQASTELKKIGEEQKAAQSSLSEGASEFGKKWVGFVTVLDKVRGAVGEAINSVMGFYEQYAAMAEHMSSVKKYTGLDEEAVRDLNEAFKQMDTRTAREQLNDLAGDAGRLGIQSKQQILDFVQAADQINVALGEDLGEDAVKNIGKLAQLFGDADRMGLKQAMLSTGSVINELAQSSSASEGYLMEFTARLAGVGHQAGMTQAQVMAFGSVLDQGMVNVEKGATALQNVITALYTNPAKMAKAAGLEVKAFTDLLKTDGNAAVLQFVQALNNTGSMDKLAPILEDMKLSGAGVTQTLSTLATNIDALRQTQQQATQAFADGTSVTNEFNVANSTAQAQLEKARKDLAEIGVEIGEKLTPYITSAMTMTKTATSVLMTLVGFISSHIRTIGYLTAAIAAYTLAVKASIVMDKLKVLWTNTIAAASKKLYATLMANPYGALIAVVALFVGWMRDSAEATEEARRQQNLLNEAQQEATAAAKKEQGQMESLLAIAKDETKTKGERLTAVKKLNELSPEYLGNLRLETINTDEAAAATRRYVQALLLKKKIEAAQDRIDKLEDSRADLPSQSYGNFLDQVKHGFADMVNGFDNLLGQPILGGEWSMAEAQAPQRRLKALTNNLNHQQKLLQDSIDQWTEQLVALETQTSGGGKPSSGGGSGGGSLTGSHHPTKSNVPTEDPTKKQSEQLAQQAEANKLAARAQYDAGIIEHKEYAEQMLIIDEELYEAQRNLYKEGTPEWVQLEQKRRGAVEAERKQYNAWSIADIDRQEQEELENIRANYAHGLLNEEQYQHALSDTKLKYLKQRADMSRDWGQTEDAEKYRQQYEEASEEEQIQRQNAFWQKVDGFRQEYAKMSAEEQKRTELAFADELHKQQLLSEEEYQKAKQEIEEKYAEKPTDLGRPSDAMSQSALGVADALKNLHDKLQDGKAQWQDYAAVGMAAMQTVMATMQSVSQLMQANMALEEAKVTKRYDAEIEKAGSSTAKGKKLEEQKQKELAKIKTKYNKKQMAMEVAQATAQTAMNAIQAYGAVVGIKVVGPILAPIAAAAAVAAGMMQIAAIKKQHAAEAAGYYEGGFTGGSSYRRTAGVVHEGEFVANHQAVNNPNILPVLQLIDHAQRTNRIASLTAADVSRAIAAPMATASNTSSASMAQPTVQVVDTSSKETSDALSRLNDRLDEGIRATVVIDGPDGLDRQWTKFNRMKKQ